LSTVTIILEVWTHRTEPPEHTGRPSCLCTACWLEYLDWCDERDGLTPA
jgi:hypothetical protein